MTTRSKLPPRRAQEDRRHWIFLARCGCPFGLVEEGGGFAKEGFGAKTEDDAWDAMYESRAEERAARTGGVTTFYVDHETYVAKYYPQMTRDCRHGGAS